MVTIFLNWIRKRLGYHVCEEFTRWETKVAEKTKVPETMDERFHVIYRETPWNQCNDKLIHYTVRWQERQCTICGKLEQRDIQ